MKGFCGKSCDSCAWRESQGCPGCGEGPGRAYSGDCEIAVCCREKGHESCATCGFQEHGCMKYRGRDEVPAVRQRTRERKLERQKWFDENAPLLGKWLWLLFWMFIPSGITGLMTNENIVEWAPGLGVPGEILSFLCSLACAFFLWQLRNVETRYRTAAICRAIFGGISLLVTFFTGGGESQSMAGLALLILIPMLGVSLYATYLEYHAHAEVLTGLDDELAEKWRKLWKWEVGFLVGLVGCILIVLISAILGMLTLLAALIGIIVVSIVKLVYLYRTAQLFRNYSVTERVALPDETFV